MIYQTTEGKSFINRDEYRDKVLGCWTGKNIGGTLGAPMEGKRDMFDVHFYTQDLNGKPEPNDDLDLQLVWLTAVEDRGLFNVNERILGDYWLHGLCAEWNEYGVCQFNMQNGLIPPLSGAVNNDRWKYSNGAWIRSEIWACLFPGEPDYAIHYAWYDACVDHIGDGIYAEIFTASMESAAFIENNVRKLIDMGLAHIPADCRVARSVKIVLDAYDKGEDWQTARNRVVKDSEDLGWFQAPANLAYTVLGLVYGEGDFGRSVCLAVNCGDDTDCTGATCGAILGIMMGRSNLPKEWIEPIGNTIQTKAINRLYMFIPETLEELTDRVMYCKKIADLQNPALIRLTDGATDIDSKTRELLMSSEEATKYVLSKPSNQIQFDLPFGTVFIQYKDSPIVKPGEELKLCLMANNTLGYGQAQVWDFQWQLPEGWTMEGGCYQSLRPGIAANRAAELTIHVGEFHGALEYLPLYIKTGSCRRPQVITVPVECAGAVSTNYCGITHQDWYINRQAVLARMSTRP